MQIQHRVSFEQFAETVQLLMICQRMRAGRINHKRYVSIFVHAYISYA